MAVRGRNGDRARKRARRHAAAAPLLPGRFARGGPERWPENNDRQKERRHTKQKGDGCCRRPIRPEMRADYFRFADAVRSALRATMKAAPHQLEPSPLGLSGVMKPVLGTAVWSPVNTLQFALEASVS